MLAFLFARSPPSVIHTAHPFRTARHAAAAMCAQRLDYVTASKAAAIDSALMSPSYGFTLTQLMELAGLAVSHVVARTCARGSRVTLVCGPGNNGGDGLVAARHLHMFGYRACVVYPKRVEREPFMGLVRQLEGIGVPVLDGVGVPEGDVVVDCVFGFSFKADKGLRDPFGEVLKGMNERKGILVCVDVPSGWGVDSGERVEGAVRVPDVLVSLTAPKVFAKELEGREGFVHYVGGRFVPERLKRELEFEVPDYEGIEQIVKVS